MTLVLVIGTLAMAGIALLKNAEGGTTDRGALEQQATQNLTTIRHGVEGVKEFLTGYLLSAGAATGDIFMGNPQKPAGHQNPILIPPPDRLPPPKPTPPNTFHQGPIIRRSSTCLESHRCRCFTSSVGKR